MVLGCVQFPTDKVLWKRKDPVLKTRFPKRTLYSQENNSGTPSLYVERRPELKLKLKLNRSFSAIYSLSHSCLDRLAKDWNRVLYTGSMN